MEKVDADRLAKRRARLEVELADEGVKLIDYIVTRDQDMDPRPNGTLTESEAAEVEELIIDELLYARHPPVHEGRRPSYGAIISGDVEINADFGDELRLMEPVAGSSVEDIRELANGLKTFVVRAGADYGLVALDSADELTLKRLAGEWNCWIVQRHPSGTVKVFGRERLFVLTHDVWRSRPYAHTRWMQLMHTTGTSGFVGAQLLDFCLHILSARHIGATLVWLPEGSPKDLDVHLAKPMRPSGIDLALTDDDHTEALASLLASVDGACIVDKNGRVIGLEAFLKSGADAEKFVATDGGTRHNSAARFSFDVAEAVVFVVSADGPVTVFSDGVDLLHFQVSEPSSVAMESLLPEISHKVRRWVEHVVCPSCGKRIIAEFQRIDGWTDNETVDCPVCKEPDIAHGRCFTIITRVAKPWEPDDASVTWGIR